MSPRATCPPPLLLTITLTLALAAPAGCGAPHRAQPPAIVSIASTPAAPAPAASPPSPAPVKPPPPGEAELRWEAGEAAARARARREGRPLLVYLRADWDATSLWMERETWSDPRVLSAGRAFVALKLDVSSAEGDAELYAQRYGADVLPTVALFDREGRRVALLLGAQRVEALLEAMQAAGE